MNQKEKFARIKPRDGAHTAFGDTVPVLPMHGVVPFPLPKAREHQGDNAQMGTRTQNPNDDFWRYAS